MLWAWWHCKVVYVGWEVKCGQLRKEAEPCPWRLRQPPWTAGAPPPPCQHHSHRLLLALNHLQGERRVSQAPKRDWVLCAWHACGYAVR